MVYSFCSEKCLRYCSIIGAHLVTAPLGFLWIYGNLSAYMDSYFSFACYPECMDGDSQWILCLCMAMLCPGTLITKHLADKVGLKLSGVVAAILLNAGLFASAWTLRLSVAGTTMLLGVLMGLMQGVGSVVAFQYVEGWAPDKASLYMASTTGASTLLSMLQNQIITIIVNPDNLKPDAMRGSRTFFSQKEILDRVPMALIVYAAMICGLQFVGYILLAPEAKPYTPIDSLNISKKEQCESDGKNSTAEDDSTKNRLEISEIQTKGRIHREYGSNSIHISKTDQKPDGQVPSLSTLDIKDKTFDSSTSTEDKRRSLTPFETLQTPTFYALFMFGISTLYALILKANYYKQFALLYIPDDRYLTLVGTLIPVVAAISRLFLGAGLNRHLISIKDVCILSLAVNSVLCAFWYNVAQVDALLYMFLILFLSLVQSVYYIIFPVASLDIFGPAHFSTNYGLLLLSFLPVGFLSPVVIPRLLQFLGWFWLFASASILCLLTLIVVVVTDFNSPQAPL